MRSRTIIVVSAGGTEMDSSWRRCEKYRDQFASPHVVRGGRHGGERSFIPWDVMESSQRSIRKIGSSKVVEETR